MSSSNDSPSKFVKPADLFKMRRRASAKITESPLKCVNNNSSPNKPLPNLLKNPFNSVKKRLYPDQKSPKKSGFIEFNEDANLEAPQPPIKRARNSCYRNDWTLRTKLRIKFDTNCKNWDTDSSTIHRRISAGVYCDESPCKVNDNSISIEAIKNIATVYQHPYLSWLPLFPRSSDLHKLDKNPVPLTHSAEVAKTMHKDWCESFDDLINLLIRGRCPFFYMCSDTINILFKSIPSSIPRRPIVQAFITPFNYSLGCSLRKLGIEFKESELTRSDSSTNLSNSALKDTSSQHSFGSSSQTCNTNDTRNFRPCSQESSRLTVNNFLKSKTEPKTKTKDTPSSDSGNVADGDDSLQDHDFFYKDEGGQDLDETLGSIGLSLHDFTDIKRKQKGFTETNDGKLEKPVKKLPLVKIEGTRNLRKLVKYLQNDRTFTITAMGKFALIPPTLLAPREFRLCTPRYPEIMLSKNMIEQRTPKKIEQQTPKKNMYTTPKKGNPTSPNKQSFMTPKKDIFATPNKTANFDTPSKSPYTPQKPRQNVVGPTYFELAGTILPNIYTQLHKILTASENSDNHTCTSRQLDSSASFGNLIFQ